MKKQQPTEQSDPQVIYRKNRHRLIQQNRQLYSEIFRLQAKVSAVLTKNLTSDFKEKVQDQKMSSKYKETNQNQITQIKKLKKKILLIKNANKPQEKQDMRLALDELTFLKKEKEKYENEKEALVRKRRLKNEGLQLNKPLQQERKNVMAMYKSAQRQNFDIKNKTIKIQRQINSFHKIKQLSKTMAPKSNQNNDFEIKKVEHQMTKLQQQIKKIEREWQPRIDSLNTEYFLLKEIKEEKDVELNELEKVLNTCKNRVLAMKEEAKIFEDRARVAQVVISPQKRQQINQIYETEKEKHEFFEQFRNRPRNQLIKLQEQKEQITKKSLSKSPNNRSKKQLFQTEPLKLFQSPVKAEKYKQSEPIIMENRNLGYNEFSPVKENIEDIQLKKPVKNFASVAVGTTFYYNEDQEN